MHIHAYRPRWLHRSPRQGRVALWALSLLAVALLAVAASCGGESTPQPAVFDLTAAIGADGTLTEDVLHVSADGRLQIEATGGSKALTAEGQPLQSLSVEEIADPPAPPPGAHILSPAYDLGPDGATFDPPVTARLTYDPSDFTDGISENNLFIAFYNTATQQWVALPSTVDSTAHTITAAVSHFTQFALYSPTSAIASTPSPSPSGSPVPAVTGTSTPGPTPTSVPTSAASSTPTPAPTPTSTATAAATPTPAPAGGGGGGGAVPASPTPTPTYSHYPDVPRITVQDVKALLDASANIAVIDSRTYTEYALSRIPGAISLPLADMAPPYTFLDSYDQIITYCT